MGGGVLLHVLLLVVEQSEGVEQFLAESSNIFASGLDVLGEQ